MDEKSRLLITPDWHHFSGSWKLFRVFLEELYCYLLRPEYLESEIVELLRDMTISLMQDDAEVQNRYSAFVQRVFSVKASIQI